ncbi:DUF262 domain-containing protein [Clostridium tagluense]|uniref:DUF262 domain-containing protein n=1 Tax=Clostridium tagluense TaxID=360422 RepID=UPI001C6F25AE|nr:DUF262 domain-containing protein [Clostridium tagluense]MBW9157678.1 DUF262 domain-containing protein [Clostridium tagluense]WLC67039.1 DUF262 domain-containing protein [Clostridium tagluense]
MKITRNVIPISDLNEWLSEGTLIINKKYQRSPGLWPKNSRAYFIDTILNDFTFPKVTIRQTIDLKTKRSIREVVDGQQRLLTIKDFIEGKIVLSAVSKKYKGLKFADLDEDIQNSFLSYEVSIDTIVAGTEEQVLEIFRRMNSYTLPLNYPEKRHASYQGEFKWFILDLVEKYSPVFNKYEVLTIKEIARMMDADLITELCQILIEGITGRSNPKLDKLYKEFDVSFPNKEIVESKIIETMDFIKVRLDKVCSAGVLTSYSFYSLFSALIYNKFGINGISVVEMNGCEVINEFTSDVDIAEQNILELFRAVNEKDEGGNFGEFVRACSATTHSLINRKMRLKWLIAALQCRL